MGKICRSIDDKSQICWAEAPFSFGARLQSIFWPRIYWLADLLLFRCRQEAQGRFILSFTSSSVAARYSRTVLSELLLTNIRPSCPKAIELTAAVWSLNDNNSSPVSTSHIRTVLSSLPEARRLPSGEKATE